MRFQIISGPASGQRSACLVLPVYLSGSLPAVTREVDRAAGGALQRVIRNGDLRGEAGETLLLPAVEGLTCPRVLLVGLGARDKLNRRVFRKALRSAFVAIIRTAATDVASYLATEAISGTDAHRRARMTIEAWYDASYRFNQMKSQTKDQTKDKGPGKPIRQTRLGLAAEAGDARSVRRALAEGRAIGEAMALARDLGNLPPNICTPSYLVQRARDVARGSRRLRIEVLNEAQLKRLGMGSFLAVTAGSREPARFIVLHYNGARRGQAPVVLVGKGITFDSGGISLKPGPQMDEMKYDMSGAGTVIAVMQAVAALELPLNVVGLVPTCENMPGGAATRPGDIVRSMSGQTIEILNTDAEGRLILCDALTYGLRLKPAVMIDIATLTGACVIALGKHRSGLLSNADDLANALLASGEAADDPAWRLPLGEEYLEQLKSPFADVANIGGREAGTITAAAFLSRFVGRTDWAHLDIAGTAWNSGSHKGSTGRPVPLLVEFLLNRRAVS